MIIITIPLLLLLLLLLIIILTITLARSIDSTIELYSCSIVCLFIIYQLMYSYYLSVLVLYTLRNCKSIVTQCKQAGRLSSAAPSTNYYPPE